MTSTTKFNPTQPSAHVGRWVETYGVTHELIEINVGTIDVKNSLHNQARLDPVDVEVVRIYRDAMKAGAIFPPLVGYFVRPDQHVVDGNIVLIDGNQRLQAALQANATAVWVHLVVADDSTILDMVGSANAILNGKEADANDRLRHGIRMVADGSTIASAARQMSISSSNLSAHIKADAIRTRADGLGLRHIAGGMKVGHMASLMPVIDDLDRELFGSLASAANVASTVLEFGGLVKRIKPLDARDRVTAIAEFVEQHGKPINARKNGGSGTKDPYRLFVMHARAIVLTGPQSVVSSTPAHRRAEVKQLADDLRYMASQIERSL